MLFSWLFDQTTAKCLTIVIYEKSPSQLPWAPVNVFKWIALSDPQSKTPGQRKSAAFYIYSSLTSDFYSLENILISFLAESWIRRSTAHLQYVRSEYEAISTDD